MQAKSSQRRQTIDELLRFVERFPVVGTEYPLIRTDGLWLDDETYLRKQLIERNDQSPRRGY